MKITKISKLKVNDFGYFRNGDVSIEGPVSQITPTAVILGGDEKPVFVNRDWFMFAFREDKN